MDIQQLQKIFFIAKNTTILPREEYEKHTVKILFLMPTTLFCFT